MRLMIILILGAMALIYSGISELMVSLKNSEPKEMTFDTFTSSAQDEGWVRITDCFIDVPESIQEERKGRVTATYIPVRSINDPSGTTNLLLKTDDTTIINVMDRVLEGEGKNLSEGEVQAFLLEHKAELYPTDPVEGVTEHGIGTMSDDTRRKVLEVCTGLSQDFVVLEHHEKPRMGKGILLLGLGLLIPAFFIVRAIRKPWPTDRDADDAGAAQSIEPG